MKLREIHKENQMKKDNKYSLIKLAVWQEFIKYVNNWDIERTINELAYPSNFEFFRTRAVIGELSNYSKTNSQVITDVFKYFTMQEVHIYLKNEIPKRVPNSVIKVKCIGDSWDAYIVIFYKGEK